MVCFCPCAWLILSLEKEQEEDMRMNRKKICSGLYTRGIFLQQITAPEMIYSVACYLDLHNNMLYLFTVGGNFFLSVFYNVQQPV